jgi:hypothetical protein
MIKIKKIVFHDKIFHQSAEKKREMDKRRMKKSFLRY